MKRIRLFSVLSAFLFTGSVLAGSVNVANTTNLRVEVCRGGGHAGCTVIEPGQTLSGWYVQTDRPFWLSRPDASRTYSVTASGENYRIYLDFDGKTAMEFLP